MTTAACSLSSASVGSLAILTASWENLFSSTLMSFVELLKKVEAVPPPILLGLAESALNYASGFLGV